MKFIQTINSSAIKLAKGMVGIFAIKLLLFGGVFLIQSCKTDKIEDTQIIEQEFALLKFESIVRSSIPRIQSAVEKQQSFTTNSMTTLSIEMQQQNEDEIVESLKPLVEGAKELLTAFDFAESDLSEEFEDLEDPRIALIGLAVLAAQDESSNQTAMNFASMFGQTVYAKSIGGCLKSALGIDLIDDFKGWNGLGKKAKKKLIRKALVKAGSRYFSGWFGAAIIVAELSLCLA